MSIPTPARPSVVLVHGFGDTHRVFGVMSRYLGDRGWSVYAPDLRPSRGEVSLADLADQLRTFIGCQVPPDPIALVGFSMGGIVSRYYVQRLGGLARVRQLVTISSPHHGTRTAYLFDRPGCRQMRPASKFLLELERDIQATLGRLDVTSIWTPYDLTIVPASSSALDIGQQVRIPVLLHPWMLRDRRCLDCLDAVLQRSLTARPPQPSPESLGSDAGARDATSDEPSRPGG